MTDDFSKVTQDVIYCHRNGLLDDEQGEAILAIYEAGVCDDVIARMFERRVANHKFEQAFHGTPKFNTPKLTKGDYVVGLDENGKELRSFIQFLNANILTVASAGAGKTTLLYFWILQIALHIQALWLFDLRKREFAILKPYLARLVLCKN